MTQKTENPGYQIHLGSLGFLLFRIIFFCRVLDIRVTQPMEHDAGELWVCMNVLMGQIGIDYSKLTKEEQMTLLRVFNKSSMLKHRTKAGMRGKHRR